MEDKKAPSLHDQKQQVQQALTKTQLTLADLYERQRVITEQLDLLSRQIEATRVQATGYRNVLQGVELAEQSDKE